MAIPAFSSTGERILVPVNTCKFVLNSSHFWTRTAKEKLQQKHPEIYAGFKLVWDIRQRHMVHELPSQYIFLLVCCFEYIQSARRGEQVLFLHGMKGVHLSHISPFLLQMRAGHGATYRVTPAKGFVLGTTAINLSTLLTNPPLPCAFHPHAVC